MTAKPSRAERLRAEADILDIEETFAKKKATKKGVTHEEKLALRAARQEFRDRFRVAKTGAAPDTIEAT